VLGKEKISRWGKICLKKKAKKKSSPCRVYVSWGRGRKKVGKRLWDKIGKTRFM